MEETRREQSRHAEENGTSSSDQFTCPECLAVLPDAKLVEYHAQDDFAPDASGWKGEVCVDCCNTLLAKFKKRYVYITWSTDEALLPCTAWE